jgi:hypothetical protein
MRHGSMVVLLLSTGLVGCGGSKSSSPSSTTPTAPRNGLVAEYLFSGDANDSQGSNDGALSGGPVFTLDRFGKANGACLLDGVNDVITTTADHFISGNNVSVSLWFNAPSTSGPLRYFVICSDFGVFMEGGNIGIAISIPATDSASGPFTANTWHHLLGTYDGTDIRCYIDGVLTQVKNHPGDISDLNHPLTFGSFNNEYWAGGIDDVRIYNRTITDGSEISDLYHEGGYAQ